MGFLFIFTLNSLSCIQKPAFEDVCILNVCILNVCLINDDKV